MIWDHDDETNSIRMPGPGRAIADVGAEPVHLAFLVVHDHRLRRRDAHAEDAAFPNRGQRVDCRPPIHRSMSGVDGRLGIPSGS